MVNILFIIILVHHSNCLHPQSALYQEIFTYHNETYEKAEFAYEVVDKIYNAFRQWFFTIIFCEFTYFENRILKYTETKDDGYPVLLLSGCPSKESTKVKPRIGKHGATAYVVTSEVLSLEVNEDVIGALIRTGVFKPRSPLIFVINVPVEVDSYFYYDMERHFQLLWSRSITNSVLIVWDGSLKVYAYNAFQNLVKDVTHIDHLGRFLNSQYNNLYGRQIRLSVFRKVFLTNETGPVKCDSRLASTVISVLNASCLPLAPRDGSTVGDLLDNGTATGVTRDLIDGYTDAELNSRILKNSYYGYIDTTYPLTHDELCFFIMKSGKLSTFESVLHLISTDILLLFLTTVFFLMGLAVFSKKIEANLLNLQDNQTSTTMIDLMKCFLKQTADIKFLGPVFRFVLFMIVTYSLIVNSVIDGTIFSAITYPRYKPDIETIKDLRDKTNVTFGIHNRHMNIFKNSLTDDTSEAILKRVEIFNDKKIKEVIEKRQFQYAVLLRKTDAQRISRNPANMVNGRSLFHTVSECPIPCSIVYGIRYGSPYLLKINDILHHLNQAGILEYWTSSEEYSMSTNLGKILLAAENKGTRSLTMEILKEVFYVWLFGLFISFIAFVFERVWKNHLCNIRMF